MSRKTRTAGAVALAAAVALIPATGATADPAGAGTSAAMRECLRPILTPQHSADVVQGWTAGCRRAVAEEAATTERDRRAAFEENGRGVLWLRYSEGPSRVWLNTANGATVVVRGAV
jgi:hypothetical protein